MEQAKPYLNAFQNAQTEQERAGVIDSFNSFLAKLNDIDRRQAQQFMKVQLRPSINENLKELDALIEKADLILSKKGKVTYEGKEYVFGDWVTIADYCRLYDFKPSRVQNWIDREIVPRQNVVVIQELNNLKLLKNIPYRP